MWGHADHGKPGMQALMLIVKRVKMLHSMGMVHRDLKPANILRMPEEHSWALIDFGCAAQAGAPQIAGPLRLAVPGQVTLMHTLSANCACCDRVHCRPSGNRPAVSVYSDTS